MTPSATGTLGATPLGHALVYARNRRLSGRLEVYADAERSASLTLWNGFLVAVETRPLGLVPGGFFGAVAYELGLIDTGTLDATLLELAKTKRLHGEILIERRALTPAQRDEVLVEQIHRKVHHLFSFPETGTYAFYDVAAPPVTPPVAVDVVGPVWRGVRDFPPMRFVAETMRRIGYQPLRATQGGSARLPPQEAKLVQELAARPMTIAELKEATDLPPGRVDLLVYVLVIAKCAEAVSGMRTHPSTGALPASMPSGPPRAGTGEVRRPSGEVTVPPPPESTRLLVSTPSSGRISIATPGVAMTPSAPPSSGRISISTPGVAMTPSAPPASTRTGMPTPGSAMNIPAAGSSPRISVAPSSGHMRAATPPPGSVSVPPASSRPRGFPSAPVTTPGSRPSMPAVNPGSPGSRPNMPAQSGPPRAMPGTLAALKTPAEYGIDGILARAETVEDEDYFSALGVAENASEEAVRAAYVRLAKTWHPDKLPMDFHPIRAEVARIFSQMTKAHRTLTDADERRMYIAMRQSRAQQTERPRAEVMRDVDQAIQRANWELAMTLCDELVRKDNDDAEALAKHAWSTTRGGEASEEELRIALVKLDRAVNIDRTSDEAIYHRGLVQKRLGNGPAAGRDFVRALQLNPRHVAAEREVRLYAMRVKKGSGEHKLIAPLLEKLDLGKR